MPISCTNEQLVEALLAHGVQPQDIEKASAYQSKFGGALENLLVNLGSLDEEQLPALYAQLLSLPQLDSIDGIQLSNSSDGLNQAFLGKHKWASVIDSQGEPLLLSAAPLSWEVNQYLVMEGIDISVAIISSSLLEQAISMSSPEQASVLADDDTLSHLEEDRLRELASEAPTVNLLNSLISKGLKLGASDMHVEPIGDTARVRYRIDGVLHDLEKISKRQYLPVLSRLKILSGMDIAEKRRPQDGKIETKIANIELDIRVSALPLNDGESMVLRFLKKESVRYDMSVLGLSEDVQSLIEEDLKTTAGVILLTGPTGSGKTTSLYTFLNKLNSDDVKIITLEDPVEYQLDGINQVQVNSDIGFNFAAGLRSIVRQDPDIIMLGEIRDKETAAIAMQSALTGHLVFSTVHTNDAPSAYTRLLDLGVEEFLLNAAIVAIVAQRLARKLCQHCATEDPNAQQVIEQYSLNSLVPDENIKVMKANGCEHCDHTGYKGRTAITEYLRCDDALKAIPKDQDFIEKAKELSHSLGRRDLLQDGLHKVARGITTIDEVVRVAG